MRQGLGIMGGTFDPIHLGHLVAAEEARVRFNLSGVVFVPNRLPPHKKGYEVTPAEQRYDMVRLATASNPAFETSRIELDRPGPSYTIDTLDALRREVGADVPLFFITGADAVRELLTWRSPEELVQRCRLIAVTRPGSDLGRLAEALGPELMGAIEILDMPGLDVSSTELRRRAAAGASLRYLTPQPVVRYIEVYGLYRGRPQKRGGDGGWP